MSNQITPEYLDVRALMIERGELNRPQKIGRVIRDAAEQIRLLNVREKAYEDEVTTLREQLAAALAGKDGEHE